MTKQDKKDAIKYIMQFSDYLYCNEDELNLMSDKQLEKMVNEASNIEDGVAIYCESLRY